MLKIILLTPRNPKFYKLNHHLGNVRATVSDLRTCGNGLVQSAAADLGKNLFA